MWVMVKVSGLYREPSFAWCFRFMTEGLYQRMVSVAFLSRGDSRCSHGLNFLKWFKLYFGTSFSLYQYCHWNIVLNITTFVFGWVHLKLSHLNSGPRKWPKWQWCNSWNNNVSFILYVSNYKNKESNHSSDTCTRLLRALPRCHLIKQSLVSVSLTK